MADSFTEQLSPTEIQSLITETAKKHGVDPSLALAVAKTESSFNPDASSPKGAYGVMQLMPHVAGDLGVNIHDVKDNIEGGVRLLKEHLARYKGDVSKTLWAYNAGPKSVESGKMPEETKAYIPKVQKNQTEFTPKQDSFTEDSFEEDKTPQKQGPDRAAQFLNPIGIPTLGQAKQMGMSDVNNIHEIYNAVKDKRYGHAAAALGKYVSGGITAIGQNGNDQLHKASAALDRKDYGAALSHLAASTVPFAPWASGIADSAESLESGDTLGGALQMGGGIIGAGVFPNKLGTDPASDLQSNAAAMFAHDANQHSIAKTMTEVYQPKEPQKAFANYKETTLPLLSEAQKLVHPDGKPLLPSEVPHATEIMTEANRSQFHKYIGSLEQAGIRIPGDSIADKAVASIPKQIQIENPEGYKALAKSMDGYRGKTFLPSELEELNQANNANNKALYDKYSIDQNTILTANAAKNMQAAKADATREALYDAFSKTEGMSPEDTANVRELQRRYGALAELRDSHKGYTDDTLLKPAPKPMSLGDAIKDTASEHSISDLFLLHDIPGLAMKDIYKVATKVGKPKTVTDATKLTEALGKNQATPLDPIPDPSWTMTPTETGKFYKTLPMHLDAVPHQEPVGSPEFNLQKSPGNRFDWQQNLFEKDPERPVMPKVDISKYIGLEP